MNLETTTAAPLAALPYHDDANAPWPLETRLIVLGSAVMAAFGLVTFTTALWIYFQPALFTTVAAPRSLRSLEFGLLAWDFLANAALVAGGAAFLARRRACRPLLIAGAVALLLGQAAGAVHYTFFQPSVGRPRSGADVLVMGLWRTGWSFRAAILPALTLVAMTRPHVKGRFGK